MGWFEDLIRQSTKDDKYLSAQAPSLFEGIVADLHFESVDTQFGETNHLPMEVLQRRSQKNRAAA
jgi:hypothetical protein